MRRTLTTSLEALHHTPLFAQCTPRELLQADRYCTFLDVTTGQVLARRDQQPGQLVIVLSGYADAIEADGARRWLEPGDCFGSVVESDDNYLIVTAVSDGMIVASAQCEVAGLLRACPSVTDALAGPRSGSGVLDLVAEELKERAAATDAFPLHPARTSARSRLPS
jgi:CRP-like cAMP-binding protein